MSSRLPYRAVVLALALAAIGLLFEQLVTLLLMVVIAVIVSLPLAAGADRLGRFRVPRAFGVLLTLLLGAAILGGVVAVVVQRASCRSRSSWVHVSNRRRVAGCGVEQQLAWALSGLSCGWLSGPA